MEVVNSTQKLNKDTT